MSISCQFSEICELPCGVVDVEVVTVVAAGDRDDGDDDDDVEVVFNGVGDVVGLFCIVVRLVAACD